ncbi:hypothetical protein [Chenggangzhangella methanolivorans]|uniref:Uncharacterized protein n=1 Tax=Chenggangzhangella methanolivorans TaxID=1437009 RepID=A0A9E6REM5_9HYPH|nr:hypothetical protein [Chenggangzhangella methanolivorans]QZN99810.1 hypothetical protein K6K41_24625 [Chenggangzhangella methanolivorans]
MTGRLLALLALLAAPLPAGAAVVSLGDSFRKIAPIFADTQSRSLTAAGDATEGLPLSGHLAVAISGAATAVELVVERSAVDPAGSPRWAKAGDSVVLNPSAAPTVRAYLEPGAAWWRVRVISIAGGAVVVDLTGTGAR